MENNPTPITASASVDGSLPRPTVGTAKTVGLVAAAVGCLGLWRGCYRVAFSDLGLGTWFG